MPIQNQFLRLLSPKSIGRLEFFIRYVPVTFYINYYISSGSEPTVLAVASILLVLTLMIPFAVLPRLRDADMSYFWLIAAFVPFLDMLLGAFLISKPAPPRLDVY